MHCTYTINSSNVKDPLFEYAVKDHKNARRQLDEFRYANNRIEAADVVSHSSFLRMLLGPNLKFKSFNLLNSDAGWISAIQCCRRVGMLPSVCKLMSIDRKLRQMDKNKKDNLNAVVLQIKGANCDGEPAIGMCFPEDEDSFVVPKFLLGPNDQIVQPNGIFKKGALGCNCTVSKRFDTDVTMSLVFEGLCIKSEIQTGG